MEAIKDMIKPYCFLSGEHQIQELLFFDNLKYASTSLKIKSLGSY